MQTMSFPSFFFIFFKTELLELELFLENKFELKKSPKWIKHRRHYHIFLLKISGEVLLPSQTKHFHIRD